MQQKNTRRNRTKKPFALTLALLLALACIVIVMASPAPALNFFSSPTLANNSYQTADTASSPSLDNFITILNLQSYPSVGGNWTIYFNTTGFGILEIHDHSFPEEVGFVGLYQKEGGVWIEVPANITGDLISAQWNYTEGRAIFKVLTAGEHTLEFRFGNVAYARNQADSNDVMLVYGEGTVGTPRYRIWNGTDLGDELSAPEMGATIYYTVVRAAPTRNEKVLVTSTDVGNVNVSIWNGTGWGSVKTLGTVVLADPTCRGFDVAYEQTSGDAIIVVRSDTDIMYWVWDGESWTVDGVTYDLTITIGIPTWIKLAHKPNSDEIALIYLDSSSYRLGGLIWDGSAWGKQLLLEANPGGQITAEMVICDFLTVKYMEFSGEAVFVWGADETPTTTDCAIKSRIWNGTGWDAELSPVTVGLDTYPPSYLRLRANPTDDQMMLSVVDDALDLTTILWNGTGWETPVEHDISVESDVSHCVDVIWENATGHAGHAVLVWNTGADQLSTRHWNGAAWGTPFDTDPYAELIDQKGLRLVRSSDNRIMVGMVDAGSDLHVWGWVGQDGDPYGSWNYSTNGFGEIELEISAGVSYEPFMFSPDVYEIPADTTPPTITINEPTTASPVYRKSGGLFYVNFTYTEENPANYTVKIFNSTATINSSLNESVVGGENLFANESFNLNASAADGEYNVSVEMYDNASNYNISYQNGSVVKDDTAPTITFISQTPPHLDWNTTGLVNITYNVTDPSGINKSTAYLAHSVYHNHPGDLHYNWSWRYPVPNPLTADGRRACNRNESRWFEPDFENIWKWGIHDNDSMDLTLISNGTYANGTEWATWNFSTNHMFPNAYPLDRREMQAENKSGQYIQVYSGNSTVVKIEQPMLEANVSLSAYVYVDDQGSTENLLIYYCNNSFDPGNPEPEPWTKYYCKFVTSLPNTFDYSYSKKNSSYADLNGMWIDENLKYGNVTATETGYFLFRSDATFAQAWKIFYADDDNIAGTMGFNETDLTWNSSDNGGNWTQFNGTIDLWFTQTQEDYDEVNYYFSVRDNLGNWGNSTPIISDSLSPYNKPPTRPNIQTPTDGEVISGTSYNIQWQEGGDPDNDDYNASVYLYNPDGTYNATLADDNIPKFTEHYEFDTTSVPEGTYRLNVTLNDTYGASSSTLTGYNFTIDEPTELAPVYRKGGEPFYVNFTYNETHPKNYTVKVFNGSGPVNTTFVNESIEGGENKFANVSFNLSSSAADGWYNVSVEMYDNASNYNISYQYNSVVKDGVEPGVFANATDYPAGQTAAKQGDEITINAYVTDTVAGVENVSVNVSQINATLTENQTMLANGTNRWNYTLIVNGTDLNDTYNLPIYAWDNASNFNGTETLEVRVDNAIPSVISNTNNVWVANGSTVILNATITDPSPGSGVKNATVNVSEINSTINEAILERQGDYWTNVTIIADRGETAELQNLTITAFDNVSNVNNSVNMTVGIHLKLPDLNITSADVHITSSEPEIQDRANLTINATVHNIGNVNATTNVNVSLYIDTEYNQSTNISRINVSENKTVTFYWIASAGSHDVTIKVDPLDIIAELNETNNNATKSITVKKVVTINITYPLNGTEIPRGEDTGIEDHLYSVDDDLTIIANISNYYNASDAIPANKANCSFYWNNTLLLGYNTTNSTGYCEYSFDRTIYNNGSYNISVNFTLLDTANYTTSGTLNESTGLIKLVIYEIILSKENNRDGAYLEGDAAILRINTVKDDVSYNPVNITVWACKHGSEEAVDTHYYPGDIVQIGTGKFYSKTIITKDKFYLGSWQELSWKVWVKNNVTINEEPQPEIQNVSSALHSEFPTNESTATFRTLIFQKPLFSDFRKAMNRSNKIHHTFSFVCAYYPPYSSFCLDLA